MARRQSKKHKNKAAMKMASQHQPEPPAEEGADDCDHTSKLPDDILVAILSLLPYTDAVRTASVSRRWERLLTHLPNLTFCMSALGHRTSKGEPSEPRVRSMERTLRRRCRGNADGAAAVQTLELVYRKDVPMECRHADDFIALANARKLVLHIQCARPARVLSDDEDVDVGAWTLELPPATTELKLVPFWYAVRPPHIHGPSVMNLRSLTLTGLTVLRQDFLLTKLPSLEHLAISLCTIDASIEITSDSMPRLKHLEIVDVSVMTKQVKAAIGVRAGELRTLRMSGRGSSYLRSPSDPDWWRLPARFSASFTVYSAFHLDAPKLRVLDWRCCYADEVRVDAVGRLSDVAVEIAAGRMPRTDDEEEHSFFSVERRDKLMTDILQGLMPGLRAPSWDYVKRKCVHRGDMWLCFEISSSSRYPITE